MFQYNKKVPRSCGPPLWPPESVISPKKLLMSQKSNTGIHAVRCNAT